MEADPSLLSECDCAGSPVPSVGAHLLAEAMLTILELPEPATPDQRRLALHGLLAARPGRIASMTLARALDARIEALCRMHRSVAFRGLVEVYEQQAMSFAVRVAAIAPVAVSGGMHEFEPAAFVGSLMTMLPPMGSG